MSSFKTGMITEATLIAFGCGGSATGIIANGMSYFLPIYYDHAIGLQAVQAGPAL